MKRYSNVTNIKVNNKLVLSNDKSKVKIVSLFNDGYDIFELTSSKFDNINEAYYKREVTMYNIEAYENIGRNILISILDVFSKNPYSRSINLNERRK